MADTPIPIALIESNALLREFLAEAISRHPDFELVVVQPCAPGRACVELVAKSVGPINGCVAIIDLEPFRLSPDQPDLTRPGEAIALLRAKCGDIRMITLSNAPNARVLTAVLRAGATAHLSKDLITRRELFAAIEAAAEHRLFLCAHSKRIVASCGSLVAEMPRLTAQEIEVARIVATLGQREPRKAIAARLNVAFGTLNKHINNIREKLGVNTDADMVQQCREMGLID